MDRLIDTLLLSCILSLSTGAYAENISCPTQPKSSLAPTAALQARQKAKLFDHHEYNALIIEAASHYRLPPNLIKAVIATESAFQPTAQSPAGALGLMQLMPATARAMQVRDVFDPKSNIFGGTRYLRLMANRFDRDPVLALAAYNAGPEIVERVGKRVPKIPETEQYIHKVLTAYLYYLCFDQDLRSRGSAGAE